MKVENVQGVIRALRHHQLKYFDSPNAGPKGESVIVGYTGAAALYVHENRQMKLAGQKRKSGLGVYWGPRGRAGFLLDVAREMHLWIGQTVVKAMKHGAPLGKALLYVGLALQRASMQNVPVEYGHLRASAFTRKE